MGRANNAEIPEEVRNLQLVRAFWGYAMPVTSCIESTDSRRFLIVDDDYTHISSDADDEARACIVYNEGGRSVTVLAIDHRLISQREGGMADGAAFNTEKFAFIEFKANALGNSYEQVGYTYHEAKRQLGEAVTVFTEKLHAIGIDLLEKTDCVCHIIVSETFPRSKQQEEDLALEFFEDSAVPLSFEREIAF